MLKHKVEDMEFLGHSTPPKTEKTMDDLPPEVVTIILKQLTRNASRNVMLDYRRVNSQWKDIIDGLLEKDVISQRLQTFPEVKVKGGGDSNQPFVVYPGQIFRAIGTPLSFNSLVLTGNNNFPENHSDNQMALQNFVSKYASNLSVLSLWNQIIAPKPLVALLKSLSSLKVLSLVDVKLPKRSIGPGWIPQQQQHQQQLPHLPSLETLELMSYTAYEEEDYEKRNALYVWLIVSYADQLVGLNIATRDPFPALQKGHQYTTTTIGRKGNIWPIATSSFDCAFKNLKQLEIQNPSIQFLQQTKDLPALTQLSIYGWDSILPRNLATLIGNCGESLQKVSLDIFIHGSIERDNGIPLGSNNNNNNNVKWLAIHWSRVAERKLLARFILSMFPALETLHLIRFGNQQDTDLLMVNDNDARNWLIPELGDDEDEINILKERLWRLCGQEEAIAIQLRAENHAGLDIEGDPIVFNLERVQVVLPGFQNNLEAMQHVREQKHVVIQRLIDLNVNVRQVIAEWILQKQEIWNICPLLNTVKLSSGSEQSGDVCVIHRNDNNIDF